MADLVEAIELDRQAVAATPAGDPELPSRLSHLSLVLSGRFERMGVASDLDEAIELGRQAVAATPADDPEFSKRLSHLSFVLSERFERIVEMPDRDEALRIGRRAKVSIPLDGATFDEFLRATGDLDEAIELGRQAVAATPARDPELPDRLALLASTLTLAAGHRGHIRVVADLDEAIELGRQAVAVAPTDHPRSAAIRTDLARGLVARFGRAGALADMEEAVSLLQETVEQSAAAPVVRMRAARMAADLVAPTRPDHAASFMARAVELLSELTPRRLERPDQQHVLTEFNGFASDAAALTLADPSTEAAQRPMSALQLLEATRTVLLGQALQVRSDVTDLADQHPKLAAEFDRLGNLLDRAADTNSPIPDRPRLARAFDELLTQIRAECGFEFFARLPARDQLVARAEQGPVVVFNISKYRSDALLLTASGATCLPLPGLSPEVVSKQTNSFREALDATRRSPTAPERKAAERRLNQILEWLWDSAADPVLEALGYHRRLTHHSTGPRVWWVPGLLAQLPIHAAGYHSDPHGPAARAVIDRVVSSYTPTIAALDYARRSPADDPAARSRSLIVAMPTTPGDVGRLHYVLDEARLLASRLPGAVMLSEPDVPFDEHPDSSPTRSNVLDRLADCAIVHFACHGAADPHDPSHSLLLLHDHATAPLTVAALSAVRLDHARLAYLSACDTAVTTNTRLVDEAIHLASAFQLAGYPHVIGTLWTIDDEIAVRIADAFYTALPRTADDNVPDVTHAAHALHYAVRTTRDAFPAAPSLWAAHLHAGA